MEVLLKNVLNLCDNKPHTRPLNNKASPKRLVINVSIPDLKDLKLL